MKEVGGSPSSQRDANQGFLQVAETRVPWVPSQPPHSPGHRPRLLLSRDHSVSLFRLHRVATSTTRGGPSSVLGHPQGVDWGLGVRGS